MHYLPELDTAFSAYWINRGDITISHVNLPVLSDSTLLSEKSIFHLLFNNSFQEDSYYTRFREVTITNFSKNIVDRISVKNPNMKCYVSSDSTNSIDLFLFTEEEQSLFDKLLEYRTTSSCDISSIIFSNLDSLLSKLIYLYIDIIHNENYDSVDTLINLGVLGNQLESMFFIYVVNETHNFLKFSTVWMDNDVVDYHVNRKIIRVTTEIIATNTFKLYNPVPENSELMYITYNGDKLEPSEFSLESVGEEEVTVRINLGITLKDTDYFVVEYYSRRMALPESNQIATTVQSEEYHLNQYLEEYYGEYPNKALKTSKQETE